MSQISLRKSLVDQLVRTQFAAASTPLAPQDPLELFLSRTSYGTRRAEYDVAKRIGLNAYLDSQLAHESIDDRALETVIANTFKTLAMTNAQIFASYGPASSMQFQALTELRGATLLRQLYSPKQLFEVMVEFWSDHFSVQHTDGLVQQFKTADDRDIRRHALGKFRDLLNANARSPAMLYYLDNYTNIATGPNENYARELMELHTLGVNGGYTEADVKAVARAFTGWTFARNTYEFVFVPRSHDIAEKTVLGKLLPARRGIEDGQEVLDILATHPSTAKFIATKLVRKFVSDSPPASLVDKVATSFTRTDGDIRAMLRTIFGSEEFFASSQQKAKRPAEFMISALRATEARLTGETFGRALNARLEQMGHTWFMWPAPNGYPDTSAYWFNTSAWVHRWNFSYALAEGSLDRGITVDSAALLGNAQTPTEWVNTLSFSILKRPLTDGDRVELINLVANGRAADQAIPAAERNARFGELLSVLLSSRYFNYR
jgi:uncharacterized protein (DUF1800 family)